MYTLLRRHGKRRPRDQIALSDNLEFSEDGTIRRVDQNPGLPPEQPRDDGA
jgi:hypothetical protein